MTCAIRGPIATAHAELEVSICPTFVTVTRFLDILLYSLDYFCNYKSKIFEIFSKSVERRYPVLERRAPDWFGFWLCGLFEKLCSFDIERQLMPGGVTSLMAAPSSPVVGYPATGASEKYLNQILCRYYQALRHEIQKST